MPNTPLPCRVSVLMPVYNCEAFLDEAIRSIRDQTFTDFEFLIVNDGSTDNSPEIIERHATEDTRIHFSTCSNNGYSHALVAMARQAKGHYLARMDGDDLALPGRFESQVAYLDAHAEVVAVGMQCEKIDEQGQPLGAMPCCQDHEGIDAANRKYGGGGIAHPCAMMRKEAFTSAGGYRPDFEPAEDGDLWLRMAEQGRLANLPEVGLHYRIHANQTASRYLERFLAVERAVREAANRRGKKYPRELMAHHRNVAWAARDAGKNFTCIKHSVLYLMARMGQVLR